MNPLKVISLSVFALFALSNSFAADYDCYNESLSVSADGATVIYNGKELTLIQNTSCNNGSALDYNTDLQEGKCFDYGSSELPDGSYNRVIVGKQVLTGQKKGDIGLSAYISSADMHVNLVAECKLK